MVTSSRPPQSDYNPAVPLDVAKIKALREKLGLSQAQAAEKAHLDRFKWSDIERGVRANLTIETLENVAKALGTTAKDLLK